MPPKSPKLYDLKKTTVWFSAASIVLFVSLVMMVLEDSAREWKGWQRRFMEYQREGVEAELEKAEKAVDRKQLQTLNEALAQAKDRMSVHSEQIARLRTESAQIDVARTQIRMDHQQLTQEQDSDRYFFEEYRAEGKEELVRKYEKQLEERRPKIQEAKLALETLEAEYEAKNALLKESSAGHERVEKDIAKLTQDQSLLEKKINKLKVNWAQALLNAPMLDFIRPSFQIQQIVLENLHDDYYFTKAQKVDRCITCHLGIDQKGFEDAPAPFRTHPRLDLFLSPDSPHPMEEFGCTTCHGGSGQSVSFTTAAHTPKDKDQAAAWKKEYHWHAMEHWKEKMLPRQHFEAACVKCHTGVVDIPQATKLNEGRRLARTFGCTGCHEIKGFPVFWKAGPSLVHVQSKLEPDWIVRWLHNPKEFRASTTMPRIFHLSNTSDPENQEKSNVAIAGIAAYLMKNSDPVSLRSPPRQGKPEEGERLVKELGCLGCHSVGTLKANDHGPELSGLGSKVKPDWLYAWLKDPKHYFAETRMPNLRLTDEEASHIVSYLLAGRNNKFESITLPQVMPEAVDQMALSFLTGKMRTEEAHTELQKMSPDERLEYVGKQSIAHQGCFGCHAIKGFENAKPIGTELTGEGSKDVKKLDFGYLHMEETPQAWFFQKLKEPRIFDQGRVRTYHEKLRMPQFDFTDQEAESLTTFLLSLQKAEIPLEMQRSLTLKEEEIEEGRKLAAKFNCQGCHTLDGYEGKIRSIIEDPGSAPPILEGEGRKVQPAWLYEFLHHPTTIRPWLTYRMPTFAFDETQLNTFVHYFNNLEDVPVSFQKDHFPGAASKEVSAGRGLFADLQCIKCHQSKPDPSLSASFLAPDLVIAKDRLRPDWALDWLKDPQAVQPGTMMPAFFPEGQSPITDVLDGDATKQIKALRDYLWVFTPEEAAMITQKKAA